MIIQRYLFREVLGAFAAVLAILLLVYGSNRLVRMLADAAAGRMSSDLLFQILALKLVDNLSLLVPLSLYIAVLLGLGRLYRDSEVVAMSAGGIGVRGIAQSVFWFSVGFSVVVSGLSLAVSPQLAAWQVTMLDHAREQAQSTGLQPGRFAEFGEGDQVVYVETVSPDRRRMGNVFVQVRRGEEQYILVSRTAYQTIRGREGGRFMVLEDGWRYSGTPGRADFVITRFERHAVRIEETVAEQGAYQKSAQIPTAELIGSDNAAYAAELQGRISRAISVIVLGMLAVPLARTSPRQGRYAKLFTAIVVYFIYSNALSIAQKLVERGDVPVAIGVWPVHAAVVGIVALLIFAQTSGRWRLKARWRAWRRAR